VAASAAAPIEPVQVAPLPSAPPVEASPSMAQFLEIKAANPDCLLWYRMGDFYELFFDDAVTASAALGIVLTKRGKHQGQDIPMCGVPIHRADEYLQRLIRAGHRVAVAEQLEDPAEARKRGSKAVVRRDVVRLVTPGTLTEDALLDAKARNYLTALFLGGMAGGAGVLLGKSWSRPVLEFFCWVLMALLSLSAFGRWRAAPPPRTLFALSLAMFVLPVIAVCVATIVTLRGETALRILSG